MRGARGRAYAMDGGICSSHSSDTAKAAVNEYVPAQGVPSKQTRAVVFEYVPLRRSKHNLFGAAEKPHAPLWVAAGGGGGFGDDDDATVMMTGWMWWCVGGCGGGVGKVGMAATW
ncbi:hypothetical protein Tco_0559289 [Tanacetum coccineum]